MAGAVGRHTVAQSFELLASTHVVAAAGGNGGGTFTACPNLQPGTPVLVKRSKMEREDFRCKALLLYHHENKFMKNDATKTMESCTKEKERPKQHKEEEQFQK